MTERASEFHEMFGELAEAFVEGASELGNFACVFGECFLAPAVGDGAEQGDERGGRGEDHAFFHAVFDEAGVVLECGREEGFARKEKHGELRRVSELIGVIFRRELLDVHAHLG